MVSISRPADPTDQDVWVLDNTAFKSVTSADQDSSTESWQAEFVACFFHKGEKDLAKNVAIVAEEVGLDGQKGLDQAVQQRIEQRLLPFLHAIAPSYSIDVNVPDQSGTTIGKLTLGPANLNGISSQVLALDGNHSSEGQNITIKASSGQFPKLICQTHFAAPSGWTVISDIDDTIKITGSVDPIAIIRTTFTEEPQTTPGMPDFYKLLNETLHPAWFYLSASPYNLYPFLHSFVQANYPHGTMILRDSSWQYLGGLLQSLTQGVQAYKVNRMQKIHSWLPTRKFVCIGDSTQSDPEAYAEIYKTYPGWVKAIFIRKVLNPPPLVGKNDPARFEKAFQGVPQSVYTVFEMPNELEEHLQRLVTSEN